MTKGKTSHHILSVYFGYHDTCVTFSSRDSILLHLEAERYFRIKHVFSPPEQVLRLIAAGLRYLQLDINDFDTLYTARFNNQFPKDSVNILGKTFKPVLTSHHENHIGTTYPSGMEHSLIICSDGGSEDGTCKSYLIDEQDVTILEALDDEIFTGKFYGTISQLIIHPDLMKAHVIYPGKTMGLSALGRHSDRFMRLLDQHWPEINQLQFNGIEKLRRLFGLSDDYDRPWDDQQRCDLAFCAQVFWQEAFVRKVRQYAPLSRNICLVGGCALNVLLNTEIQNLGLFENVYVPPAPGDGGQSLGAILFHNPQIRCDYPFLGRGFGEVDAVPAQLVDDLLAHKIVAWYQGRAELGPRALGHRSFLGLPDSERMRVRLSQEVKKREPYRPVAPIVSEEHASQFFMTNYSSPFMSYSPLAYEITRSKAPAVIHYDGTARVQTLAVSENPVLHQVLTAVGEATGLPILMNTSLNVAGEPIVDTPKDALRNFQASGADVLFVNGQRFTN